MECSVCVCVRVTLTGTICMTIWAQACCYVHIHQLGTHQHHRQLLSTRFMLHAKSNFHLLSAPFSLLLLLESLPHFLCFPQDFQSPTTLSSAILPHLLSSSSLLNPPAHTWIAYVIILSFCHVLTVRYLFFMCFLCARTDSKCLS